MSVVFGLLAVMIGNPGTLVQLHTWSTGDLELLRRCNVPEMMDHLGGPETEEQLIARNERYLALCLVGTARMFRITIEGVPEGVGSVGFWESTWEGEAVYESGWSVVPEFQGRGLASKAVIAALEIAKLEGRRRFVHAFPVVDNAASNAVCRKSGFLLLGETEFEYPPGVVSISNNWRFDLAQS